MNILAKSIIAAILLFMPLNELNKIAKINEHKKAAEEAYLADNFEKAAVWPPIPAPNFGSYNNHRSALRFLCATGPQSVGSIHSL